MLASLAPRLFPGYPLQLKTLPRAGPQPEHPESPAPTPGPKPSLQGARSIPFLSRTRPAETSQVSCMPNVAKQRVRIWTSDSQSPPSTVDLALRGPPGLREGIVGSWPAPD